MPGPDVHPSLAFDSVYIVHADRVDEACDDVLFSYSLMDSGLYIGTYKGGALVVEIRRVRSLKRYPFDFAEIYAEAFLRGFL